jgi:hypothetical protein
MPKVFDCLKLHSLQKDRWDNPLFTLSDVEPTPLEEIADVILFQKKRAKDPVATKAVLIGVRSYQIDLGGET